jgi:hypothetical protein
LLHQRQKSPFNHVIVGKRAGFDGANSPAFPEETAIINLCLPARRPIINHFPQHSSPEHGLAPNGHPVKALLPEIRGVPAIGAADRPV